MTNVSAIGFAGAITTLLMWLLTYFNPHLMELLPPGGEAAVTTIISVVVGYLAPSDFMMAPDQRTQIQKMWDESKDKNNAP